MTLSQLNVRIAQQEHDHLENLALQTEGILTKAGVVRLLIRHAMNVGWDPLDRPDTLGGPSAAGTPSTSKAVIQNSHKDSKSIKKVSAYIDISELIDEQLLPYRDDLIAWWAQRRTVHGKQAIGTEQAWNASQNALKAILRIHGAKVTQDTVTAALANGWRGFRESYAVLTKQPAFGVPPEPPKHPASRLFRNGRFVDEEPPVTNPLLVDAF